MAHGNMLSPQVATPGTAGSVVRRKPVKAVKSVEKEGEEQEVAKVVGEKRSAVGKKAEFESKGKRRMVKPMPRPKFKSKSKAREATPSDDSSDDDFAPDPASPTSNKRRCTELSSKADDMVDLPSPFLTPSDKAKAPAPTTLDLDGSASTKKSFKDMSIDELLAHHGVNTPDNPYKAHLLSRDQPVVSNPVIKIPEVVKRGFKPRPSAEEMEKNIQDKVREKLGLPKPTVGPDGSAQGDVEDVHRGSKAAQSIVVHCVSKIEAGQIWWR